VSWKKVQLLYFLQQFKTKEKEWLRAKNYLNSEEIDALNKIVTAYLDIAEVRALAQEPMYMKDCFN